jgi:hypothetical protein
MGVDVEGLSVGRLSWGGVVVRPKFLGRVRNVVCEVGRVLGGVASAQIRFSMSVRLQPPGSQHLGTISSGMFKFGRGVSMAAGPQPPGIRQMRDSSSGGGMSARYAYLIKGVSTADSSQPPGMKQLRRSDGTVVSRPRLAAEGVEQPSGRLSQFF